MQISRNSNTVFLLVAVFLLAPLTVPADSPNLLVNPGFDAPSTGDGSGWQMFQFSMLSKNHARNGEFSIYHGGFSRTLPYPPYSIGNDSGAFQEFPAEPGSTWRLTGYGLIPNKLIGSPAFGLIQISFFDDQGRDLGTVETAGGPTRAKLSAEINAGSPVDEWIFLDTGIATAPEGTALVRAFTLFVDHSGSDQSQGVYFDDLTLCEASMSDDCGSD